jgi:hypothetical protein
VKKLSQLIYKTSIKLNSKIHVNDFVLMDGSAGDNDAERVMTMRRKKNFVKIVVPKLCHFGPPISMNNNDRNKIIIDQMQNI